MGSLYPTLSSLSSGPIALATNESSLHNRVTKCLEHYLQEAEQLRDLEDNYFNAITRSTNTSPMLELEEQVDHTSKNELVQVKSLLPDVKESTDNILESQMADTGNTLQHPAVANSIAHEDTDPPINLFEEQVQSEDEQNFEEEDTITIFMTTLDNTHIACHQTMNT